MCYDLDQQVILQRPSPEREDQEKGRLKRREGREDEVWDPEVLYNVLYRPCSWS